MSLPYLIVVLVIIIGACFVMWQLSNENDEDDEHNGHDDHSETIELEMLSDCGRELRGIKSVIREMGHEIASASGMIASAALTKEPFGKTEWINEIDKRLGDGVDDETRETIRKVAACGIEVLAERTTQEVIAFSRHVTNR